MQSVKKRCSHGRHEGGCSYGRHEGRVFIW